MNWPEAFERSTQHLATAYLWQGFLSTVLDYLAAGFGWGIGCFVIWKTGKFIWWLIEQESNAQKSHKKD